MKYLRQRPGTISDLFPKAGEQSVTYTWPPASHLSLWRTPQGEYVYAIKEGKKSTKIVTSKKFKTADEVDFDWLKR